MAEFDTFEVQAEIGRISDKIREAPRSRERSIAITKLEEAILWLMKEAMATVGESNG